jgi:hypothetical protein
MRRHLPGLLVAVFLLASCGSSGGSSAGDAVLDAASADGDSALDVAPPKPTWAAVPGATMDAVKQLKGFACGAGSLHVSLVGNMTEGLFSKPVADESEFAQVFTGVGLLAMTDAGVLLAQYGGQNETSSLTLVTADGAPTDTGYAFEQTEIRALQVVGSFVLALAKDWTVAEYMVHRGSLAAGTFEQLGKRLNETAMSMYATTDTVYLLTQMNEYSGTRCYHAAITSGDTDEWVPCEGFPEYVKYKEGQAFSIKAVLYGSGSSVALWFRVNDKGEEKYRHYVTTGDGVWTEIAGFPQKQPSAWYHDGTWLYLGFEGAGSEESLYRAAADGSVAPEPFGLGFGEAVDKSGPVALCGMDQALYAVWLDYQLSGSVVTIYGL